MQRLLRNCCQTTYSRWVLSSLEVDVLSSKLSQSCDSLSMTQCNASSLLTVSLPAHFSAYPLTPLVQNAPLFSICAMPISCLSLLIHANCRDKWKQMIAHSASTGVNSYHTFPSLCQYTQKTPRYEQYSVHRQAISHQCF